MTKDDCLYALKFLHEASNTDEWDVETWAYHTLLELINTHFEDTSIPWHERLGISSTSLLELKKRLGYTKGDERTAELIEATVDDIMQTYGKVTLSTINRYWGYKKKEVK